MMDFKRIKLSQTSTKRLQLFKARTGLTPNIACRIALGLSMSQENMPAIELYSEESGQEINRYTLLGEHELMMMALFRQWCHDNNISEDQYNKYFIAHINNGVELLVNRVKGLGDFSELVSAKGSRSCESLESGGQHSN